MHATAKQRMRTLSDAALVTSDYVLDEMLTRWLTTGRAQRGLEYLDAILTSPRFTVVFVDQRIFHLARNRAEAYQEHRLSFTDCTNVVFVGEMRLDAIFAFDDGFSNVGLNVVS
jgi:predicted nucleic acid-binding protein